MKIKIININVILLILFLFPILTLAQSSDFELTRSLRLNTQGEDVKALQKFLAKDSEIYPEGLATGYFGLKTQTAVKKWQKKYGIDPIGNVGPKTIAKIKEIYSLELPKENNAVIQKVEKGEQKLKTTSNDSVFPTAKLIIKAPAPTKVYIKLEASEEVSAVYDYCLNIKYGSTKEISTQYFSSPTEVYIENLTPSTTYQVRAKITDRANNIGYSENYTFTTPSIDQAPLLSSGPNVTNNNNTLSTSVVVNWETNIPCVGTLYYGTNTNFSNFVRSDYTDTNHSSNVTGLGSGITYIYKVTCATTKKLFESDNYLFIATSSTSSAINSPTLASVLESLKGLLEKMITIINE